MSCGDVRLSYRQLSERVMQLGRVLIESGIGAEDVVAIGIPRSVDTLVALFGVLASGAAYMPLDLDYPRERLALMCDDARPVMLLTHSDTRANMPDLPQVLCLDDAPCLARCAAAAATPITDDERRVPLNEAHLAYMIYTSGSTGKPKGVMSTAPRAAEPVPVAPGFSVRPGDRKIRGPPRAPLARRPYRLVLFRFLLGTAVLHDDGQRTGYLR